MLKYRRVKCHDHRKFQVIQQKLYIERSTKNITKRNLGDDYSSVHFSFFSFSLSLKIKMKKLAVNALPLTTALWLKLPWWSSG